MENVEDLNYPPIIGKTYWIRCIRSGVERNITRTLPVIGDFHWDREIINFPDEHIHINWQFLSPQEFDVCSFNNTMPQLVFSKVISKQFVILDRYEKRLCHRTMPRFPLQNPEHHIEWFPQLEKFYCTSSSKIFDDSQERCPHRGINLSSIACNKNGLKVCPAHGLQWDSKGDLVSQVFGKSLN